MPSDSPLRRVAREERRSWIVGAGLVALFLLLMGGPDPAPPQAMTEAPPAMGARYDLEVRP